MVNTRDILKLPVYTMDQGKYAGKVVDHIVNIDEARVDYLLVSKGNKYLGVEVIPIKSVLSIGDSAVTIKTSRVIKELQSVKAAVKLLEEDIELHGKEILLENGDLLGVVKEYYFDCQTGKITKFEYSKPGEPNGATCFLNADDVQCYGFDILVAQRSELAKVSIEMDIETEVDLNKQIDADQAGALYFREKQRQYILGKRITHDIRDHSDNIIVPQGSIVTSEILELLNDNYTFMQLTQCAR